MTASAVQRLQRIVFCVVTAVSAAAFADPLIEFCSNAGFFGPGNWTDHSNLDVIPALGVSVLLAVGLVAWRIRYLLARRSLVASAAWLASGEALRPNHLARLVPLIFAVQLMVLFAMETAEQVIVAGHSLGGTIWLGAPVAISLVVHAVFAIVAAFAISRALGASTKTAIRIIVQLATATVARGSRLLSARFHYPAAFRRSAPLVCRIGERAPPLRTA